MNVKVDGLVVYVRSRPFLNTFIAVVYVFSHRDIEHFADFFLPVLIHWFVSQLTYLEAVSILLDKSKRCRDE